MSHLGSTDWYLEELASDSASSTFVRALGERESMGTTTQGEDLWRGNELASAPTSHTSIPFPALGGEQMSIVSEHAQDTAGGTGVRTVKIPYLDGSNEEATETVTMNGTTPVNLAAADASFINDMYSASIGSNGVAKGHIYIYKTADSGAVYNMIAKGGNKSLVPHRMVPAGKVLILRGWHATEAQGKRCVMRIRSTDMNGVRIAETFCFKDTAYIKQGTTGWLPLYERIPALSVVKVSAWPDTDNAEASCSWMGVLRTA